MGRKEDVVLFEDFIKRYVPSNVRFGDDDDVLPVINRFLAYIRVHLLPLRNYSCGKKPTGYGSAEPAPYYYNANMFLLNVIYRSSCM